MASLTATQLAAPEPDILHLLFNSADGILANEPPQQLLAEPLSPSGLFDCVPDRVLAESLASPEPPAGAASASSRDSTDSLPAFDLDSFLSGADCLGHSAYDIDAGGAQPQAQAAGGGGGGGPMRSQRRKRQLLPYSIGDVDDLQADAGEVDDDGCGDLSGELRGQPGETLELSREEKRLAAQLGLQLPTHFPLTREEERSIRTIRRKIRNKISAKNSRAKRQEYVRGLELRAKSSSAENAQLREKCSGLEQQNRRLMAAVRRLQSLLQAAGSCSQSSAAGKATGTGLLILCLSFALFLSPQLSLFQQQQRQLAGGEVEQRPASGRRILQAPAYRYGEAWPSADTTPATARARARARAKLPDELATPTQAAVVADDAANATTTTATSVGDSATESEFSGDGFHDDSDDAFLSERELHDREL